MHCSFRYVALLCAEHDQYSLFLQLRALLPAAGLNMKLFGDRYCIGSNPFAKYDGASAACKQRACSLCSSSPACTRSVIRFRSSSFNIHLEMISSFRQRAMRWYSLIQRTGCGWQDSGQAAVRAAQGPPTLKSCTRCCWQQ